MSTSSIIFLGIVCILALVNIALANKYGGDEIFNIVNPIWGINFIFFGIFIFSLFLSPVKTIEEYKKIPVENIVKMTDGFYVKHMDNNQLIKITSADIYQAILDKKDLNWVKKQNKTFIQLFELTPVYEIIIQSEKKTIPINTR